MEFQALFHNYVKVPSDNALIYPLNGKSYYDKTEATEEARRNPKTEVRDGVDVRTYTDFVYEDAGKDYKIKWPAGCVEMRTSLNDLVIWNPQAELGKSIADMEEGGWKKYVCVEPGHVRGFIKLEKGAQPWVGQQVLTFTGENVVL